MSKKPNALIKVSGAFLVPARIGAVADKIGEWNKMADLSICVGAGHQINEEFKKRRLPIEFNELGQQYTTREQHLLAERALWANQGDLGRVLNGKEIHVHFVGTPIVEAMRCQCLVSPDHMILLIHGMFTQTIILTTPERLEHKKLFFKNYPKVKVITL